jgi:hypothetical protein
MICRERKERKCERLERKSGKMQWERRKKHKKSVM